MIDGIKRIAEGVIESGKQCSVYTGEITSITPLIIKISDELSLSTQLVVTGRVQTMLNDGDLIVGNSVALLRYQGGQNFLVMDEMDATTPDDWDSMAVINLQNHMEDLIKHITPAERLLWNQNADNVPLANHVADDVRHIFDWERTAWNEAVSNIPLNNHIADSVKHVTSAERTAWAKNVVDLDTHIGDQIKHITEDERTAWNVHKNNVIIHVTNADKIKWNDHIADEVIHITDGERTGWNSKTDDTTANGHIDDLTPHVTADDKTRLGNTVLSTVQTLTTGQKAQARTNIGAVDTVGVDGQIESKFISNLTRSVNIVPHYMFRDSVNIETFTPKPLAIGYCGFARSNVKTIDLTECKVFLANSFLGCTNLTGKLELNPTVMSYSVFNGCTGIESIDINTTFYIANAAFSGCSKLTMAIFRSPTIMGMQGISALSNTPIADGTGFIYVPDALVNDYKTATNWVTYASQIKGISELP